MVTTDAVTRANARGAALQKSGPTAESARYDRRIGRVVVRLSTGLDVAFSPHDAQGLEAAKPADLARIEISPSGLGLHFPKLDADLYLPALLEGFLGSKRWAAARGNERAKLELEQSGKRFYGYGYVEGLNGEYERNDPDLVAAVEALGKEASGECASLSVVEIPDDVDWYIEEYDGSEWVAEKHRTWP